MTEIIDDHTQKCLAYVEAVNRAGAYLSARHVDAYTPRRGGIYMLSENLMRLGTEPVSGYLLRVGWIEEREHGAILITEVGRAVLRQAETQSVGASEDALVETVLKPEDELAYARLVRRIAQESDVLVVDPYFRLDQLLPLVMRTDVTRILTSNKLPENERAGLATAVEGLKLDRRLEARVAPGSALHDRYVIASTGVATLGTSFNGVGAKLTVYTQLVDAAESIREHYEAAWQDADVLAVGSVPEASDVVVEMVVGDSDDPGPDWAAG